MSAKKQRVPTVSALVPADRLLELERSLREEGA